MSELGISKYELEAWIGTLGSTPIECIAHEDRSESYARDEAHVYKLENGQYAVIVERGCSCYEYSDAEIELFPTKKAAMEAFETWGKHK